jgi:hypothetical protein
MSITAPSNQDVPGLYGNCTFTLRNTGAPAATDPSLHPQDVTAYLNSDIYRLSVSVDGQGWSAQLQNALAAVKFGDSKTVPVYVTRVPGNAASAKVTLKVVSESDPTKTTAATTCIVSVPNPGRSSQNR